ncbi:MAG: PH domain-containing protein [Lysobacter sp.]|nr:PH domain-containing protein [Lysobacter sp.]
MTTPETPELAAPLDEASPERRLHPMSWLFVLIQQLRQFIIPIIVLFAFGRGDRNDLWGLVAICVLAVISIWQYYTYRFRIGGDSLQIRSGLLERSLREIPFARIQNVALRQTVLHRIFGVAEVRLESAGGIKPEAEMRVLTLADAMALEALVRRRRGEARTGATAADAGANEDGEVLLRLSAADIIRAGLISNRGMVVVGGGFAALAQFSRDLFSEIIESWVRGLFGVVEDYGRGHEAAAVLAMIVLFLALVRLFSIALAFLQYHGFRLEEHGRRLTLERGLLSRARTSTPRRRIQSWTLREGMLHRLFGRRSLEVSTAVLENGSDGQPRSLREIAPVATPERCDALIRHLAPQVQWPPAAWHPLHRATFWRLAVPQWLLTLAIAVPAGLKFGIWGAVLVCLWLPWAGYIAWQHARHAGYSVDARMVAVRGGWWTRTWRFAEIGKLQAIRFSQSPLDRMLGTATLLLDTAGGSAVGDPLRLRYIPAAEARALDVRLADAIARSTMRW